MFKWLDHKLFGASYVAVRYGSTVHTAKLLYHGDEPFIEVWGCAEFLWDTDQTSVEKLVRRKPVYVYRGKNAPDLPAIFY